MATISPLPTITVEYIGATLELLSFICISYIALLNAIPLFKTFKLTQFKALIVALLIILAQLPTVIHIFSTLEYFLLYRISNAMVDIASCAYLFFQISIFERFRSFTSIHGRWTTALYVSTVLVFFGFDTPILLGYDGTYTDPTSVFHAWLNFNSVFFIYVSLVDVVLNSYLLRIFLRSNILSNTNVAPEELKKKKRVKATLWFFLISTFVIDIVGVLTLVMGATTVTDELSYRTARGFSLIAGSVFGFHCCMGLSYLTMLASLRTHTEKSKSRKTPLQTRPIKNMESSFPRTELVSSQ